MRNKNWKINQVNHLLEFFGKFDNFIQVFVRFLHIKFEYKPVNGLEHKAMERIVISIAQCNAKWYK